MMPHWTPTQSFSALWAGQLISLFGDRIHTIALAAVVLMLTNSVFASNMLDHTTGFTGTTLAGVNFSKENLGRSVDLSGAVLSDTTNFAGAVLSDFPNSNQGVNLSCVVSGQTETGGCHFPPTKFS